GPCLVPDRRRVRGCRRGARSSRTKSSRSVISKKSARRIEGYPLYTRTMGIRALVLVPMLAACGLEEPKVGQVGQELRCADDFCTANSPIMAVYGTWEFNINHVPNGQGITVLALGKGSEFFQLVVHDSRIIGYDAYGYPALQGSDLVGARIYLDIRGRQSAI